MSLVTTFEVVTKDTDAINSPKIGNRIIFVVCFLY